jgi:predicted O-methyltransferase YrrM
MDLNYWSRAAKALAHELRTDSDFRKHWLSAGLLVRPKARECWILDLFPDIEGLPIELGEVAYRRSNMDPMEQFCIRAMLGILEPGLIFEIGTYDGATTLAMARAAPTAEVITLDLPPDFSGPSTVESESDNVRSGGVGNRFRNRPESERITQVLGDSRTFDFSPWEGRADLVLVDANHEYEYAKVDTASALRLVRPGGWVLWDDYSSGWPGVVRAVDETGLDVVHLTGTGIAAWLPARA